jgi:hypothetical protein
VKAFTVMAALPGIRAARTRDPSCLPEYQQVPRRHMIKLTTKRDLHEQHSLGPDHTGLGCISPEFRDVLLSNPTDGDDQQPVQILGVEEGKVIAQMNLVCGQICVEGQQLRILWGSGYNVPAEHRPTGIGAMILLRMHRLPYAVGGVGASQMAAPLFRKLNWIDFVAPRFLLLRRMRPVLEAYLGAGLLTTIGSIVGDLALRVLGFGVAMMTKFVTRGLRIERIERMPESLEPCLQRIDKPAYCHRSTAWLNWVILATPGGNPLLYLVKDRRGVPVGYFLITHHYHEHGGGGRWKNFVLGSVKDWMTFNPRTVTETQLVLLAVSQLMRRKLDAIDVCVAEPEVGNVLRRCGLREIGGMHFTFRPLPNTVLAQAKYHNIGAWRFRPVDGDYFMF